jgi:hypothetical protein
MKLMRGVCFCFFLFVPAVAAFAAVPGHEQDATAKAPDPARKDPVQPGKSRGTVIRRQDFRPLTGEERRGLYWGQTFLSPGAFFASAGPALGAHLRNDPPQWGQGAGGYARRFGDRFARNTIQNSIEAAGAAALGYDVRHVRCNCNGFFPRFGHAIAWNFLTLNRHGQTVISIPRVGSAFAAEFIGNTWIPSDHRSRGDALRGVGVELAIGSLFNAIREFIPGKKNP